MKFSSHAAGIVAAATVALVSGCAVQVTPIPQYVVVHPAPVPTVRPAAPVAVLGVYFEPPMEQPLPVMVAWAPPPMLVEAPPPMPFPDAIWIGGYWTWQGNWVWAAGRWSAPPQPHYHWVHPYYEHRDDAVIFVGGHWGAPGVEFVAPPLRIHLELEVVARGVTPGPRPIGPMGVFVPPPPGSRPGLVVPAPIGTAPAVVMSAPPVMNVGMRVQANGNNNVVNTTNNNNHITNFANITNITNVTVIAPAAATASGRAYEASVPAQAHLAAALPPAVHAPAPVAAAKPLPPGAPTPNAANGGPRPVTQATPAPAVNANTQTTHERAVTDFAAPQTSQADKPTPSKPPLTEPVVHASAPAAAARPLPPAASAPSASAAVVRPIAPPAIAVNTGAQATHDKPVIEKAHSESAEEKEKRLKKEKEELERRAKGV